ncbi:MAG: nitroreductase family protein [Chloroflexota bacterium]
MIDEKTWVNGTNWAAVAETIRTRRSNLNVDLERPVPRELIDELVELAISAPNHYRTNPWRFVVLTGPARARLGEIAARALAAQPDAKESFVERQRTQFLRAPAVIAVASAGDADPVKHFENKHAVAAGVQNIQLGATAAGLASAWRSGAAMVDPSVSATVKEALGLEPTDEIVSFLYLGYPIAPPGSRTQPRPWVHYLEE